LTESKEFLRKITMNRTFVGALTYTSPETDVPNKTTNTI